MTTIIINTLAGMLPTDANELKEYMDHCESIEADCVETLHNEQGFVSVWALKYVCPTLAPKPNR